ncbi:MAG: hypothetical protein EAZ15_00200 [Sphingobacteriales bacterium]|nr:MAG: hypothetical protein EAZ15_00200 [Sphingobacteriales bacterium]
MNESILKLSKYLSTNFLVKISQQKTIVPLYHIISDENVPHVKHLYAVKSKKDFINDLDFLLKNFTPVSFHDFYNSLNTGNNIKKPAFLLTFDDGLKEFYTVVAPILKHKGIPAICFLNSGFIDNKALFYRYKVSLLIDYIQENKLHKMVSNAFPLIFKANNKIIETLLKIQYIDSYLLDQIALKIGLSFTDFLRTEQPYLTNFQIKELICEGFSFGAHSIDHPLYADLSLENQLYQTQNSVISICQQFKLNYKAFAFPFTDTGINSNFFTQIYQENFADITFGTAGLKTDLYNKNIQRIPLEQGNKSAKSIINTEIIKALLRTCLGKNKVLHLY